MSSDSPRLLLRTNWLRRVALLTLLGMPCFAFAQRGAGMRGGFGFAPHGARGYAGRYGRAAGFYGDPFLFADDPETFIQPTPQFVVVEPPSAMASPPPEHISADPLLIELRGDKYVRVKQSSAGLEEPLSQPQVPQHTSQPPVLVYRDGHREEIPHYAIANGMIYLHGNYWQNGYWTKTVPVSALDVAATLQTNQQRGVNFTLPSAPNVVIASF